RAERRLDRAALNDEPARNPTQGPSFAIDRRGTPPRRVGPQPQDDPRDLGGLALPGGPPDRDDHDAGIAGQGIGLADPQTAGARFGPARSRRPGGLAPG